MNQTGTADQAAQLRSEGAYSVLENQLLRVTIAPQRGGKILSFFSKRSGTEWLAPPVRAYEEAKTTGGFEDWDGGGFDECLPSVAATDTTPDHGELWRVAWIEEPSGGALMLRASACQGTIELRRRAWLEGTALVLDYTMENVGGTPRSVLYSAHPLFRVEAGDRIELPPDVDSVMVESSRGERLAKPGRRIAWPLAEQMDGSLVDLSYVGPPDGRQADKLFAGPCATGWCQLQRPALGEALELSFDCTVLPYLGVWICRAAWPSATERKQYTVALEPTHASCDSLADAERNGTAWKLAPGERRAWSLRLRAAAIAKEVLR